MNLSYRNSKNADFMARYWNKPLDKPDWYKIDAKADEEASELMIYEPIGWPWMDIGQLARDLSDMKSRPIKVRINSPGGDVWDGLAVFNLLQNHPGGSSVLVEGLAASVASIIMLAGKKVEAYSNTMVMVHDPWTCACGNQYDFAEIGSVLSKISNSMVDIYAQESKMGKREVREAMKAETWFTAKEAKEKGLIDNIIDGDGAKASFDLSIFSNVPDRFKISDSKQDPTIRDLEKALRDAGLSKNKAKAVLAGRWPAEGTNESPDDINAATDDPIKPILWDDSIVARLTQNINIMTKGL